MSTKQATEAKNGMKKLSPELRAALEKGQETRKKQSAARKALQESDPKAFARQEIGNALSEAAGVLTTGFNNLANRVRRYRNDLTPQEREKAAAFLEAQAAEVVKLLRTAPDAEAEQPFSF